MSDSQWSDRSYILKPIDWLKPYPDNPRMITEDDVRSLARIIEEQGWLDPIQAREDGTILTGHRRLLAAKHLKLKRVPVLIHYGMTDEEAHAYRIGHNKTQEHVKWNRSMLADQLSSMEIAPDLMGFSEADIGKLFDLDLAAQADQEAEEKAAEEALPGPFLRQGETWFIGPATLTVWSDRPDSIRKVEGLISKMEKWLKAKATLGSEDGPTFAATIAERAMSAGEDL
jgi:ParB-like chromosome segregation protein Spo0J